MVDILIKELKKKKKQEEGLEKKKSNFLTGIAYLGKNSQHVFEARFF